jgi:hypothetical protein
MATIISPATHAQTESTLGQSYVFAAEGIREEITESTDILSAGLVQGVGDLAGSGSDTLYNVRFGAVGFAERMTAMSTETQAIPASGWTAGNDSISIGRYGLAKEESLQYAILSRPGMVDMSLLSQKVAESWLSTLRYLVAVAGSTFSSGSGTTGVVWTVDDELDLIQQFHETEGFDPRVHGAPMTQRYPTQFTQLRDSLRNEPGMQQMSETLNRVLSMQSTVGGAFDMFGFRNYASWDVPSSGGDKVGCAYVAGALAYCIASTASLQGRPDMPPGTVYVPEYGLLIIPRMNGNIATGAFDANAWMGVAKRSATLAPQFKITSLA